MSKFTTGRGRVIESLPEMREYAAELAAYLKRVCANPEWASPTTIRNRANDAAGALEDWEAAEAAGRLYNGGER